MLYTPPIFPQDRPSLPVLELPETPVYRASTTVVNPLWILAGIALAAWLLKR